MKAHEEPHVKHLARNSAKVLRWGATRSGRTTLAVRATTLPCPPWPIGRRQNVGTGSRVIGLSCNFKWNWKKIMDGSFAKQNLRGGIPMKFEATEWFWIRVIIPFAFALGHGLGMSAPTGALGWKGGWPLEDWARGPRRRGGGGISLPKTCGSPKTWKQKLRFAGRDVHIFCVIFLLICFFFQKLFFSIFERNSEHLGTSRSRLVFAPSLQVLQIFVTFQKVVKLQLSKAEMSKMDSLWEITDMNRSYQHSTYATYHLSVRTCAGLYTRYGS